MLENLEPAPKLNPPKDWRPAVQFDGTNGEATTPPTTGNQPDFDQFLLDQGFDPALIEIYGPIRTSRWQQREGGDWLVSWRFTFRTRIAVIDLPTLYAQAKKQVKVEFRLSSEVEPPANQPVPTLTLLPTRCSDWAVDFNQVR